MKYASLAGLLALCSAAASAQTLEVASGDWDDLPWVNDRGVHRISVEMLERVHALGRAETCNVPGLSRRHVDLAVPIAIKFSDAGTVERVLVRDMGCRELETIIGSVALRLATAGDYRPAGNVSGWYQSRISFVSEP